MTEYIQVDTTALSFAMADNIKTYNFFNMTEDGNGCTNFYQVTVKTAADANNKTK